MRKEQKKIIVVFIVFTFLIIAIDQLVRFSRLNSIIKACVAAFGSLSDEQKESIRLIVQSFDKYGDKDLNKLIYILATAEHESSLVSKEEHRTYSARQEAYWYTGYYGRGFVQLTHKKNYLKMSEFLGVDLVTYPSLALAPNNAAKILVYGMMEGRFTRKPLGKYINAEKVDFFNARRTVNGIDRAKRIANAAQLIQSNLT